MLAPSSIKPGIPIARLKTRWATPTPLCGATSSHWSRKLIFPLSLCSILVATRVGSFAFFTLCALFVAGQVLISLRHRSMSQSSAAEISRSSSPQLPASSAGTAVAIVPSARKSTAAIRPILYGLPGGRSSRRTATPPFGTTPPRTMLRLLPPPDSMSPSSDSGTVVVFPLERTKRTTPDSPTPSTIRTATSFPSAAPSRMERIK